MIKALTHWKERISGRVYVVQFVDADGVYASDLSLDNSWFSPAADFLKTFLPL